MAKCMIIFEDTSEGGFEMKVEFDPPINNPLQGHTPTPAQNVGWQFSQALMEDFKRHNEEEEG